MIFENCIEKNFHVSVRYMKRLAATYFRNCCECNEIVKNNKGHEVNTLAPQAMKDVPSCEKPGVAAKKR